METALKPWQIMPANIIKSAIDHLQRKNDFDDQVAFLLLDVGVETTFKTYLSLRGKLEDNKDLGFKDLINAVKSESKSNDHKIDFSDAEYFHKIRNKLYHRGDGTKPTDENLQRYSKFAQETIKILLDVDVKEIKTEFKYTVRDEKWETDRTIEDLASDLSEKLKYFHESCAIIVEQLQPSFATRKFALEFQSIWEKYSYEDSDFETELSNAQLKIKNSIERLTRYNESTGEQSENHELIDFLLEDINHFYTIKTLQKLSAHFKEDWNKYLNIIDAMNNLSSKWKWLLDYSSSETNKIYREYVDLVSQIETQQNQLDEWIKENIPSITRSGLIDYSDF